MKAIGWETFGRIRAQLDAGLDREAVLVEASIDAATWMAEEESALAELADDVECANFANLATYRRAYRTTWTELTGLPLVGTPEAVESPSPPFPPPAPPGDAPAASVQKASFQLAPPIAPWAPSSPSAATTAARDSLGPQDDSKLPAWLASVPAGDQTLPFPACLAGVPAGEQTLPPLALDERARNPLPFIAPEPAPQAAPVTSVPAGHSVEETLIGPGLVIANPLPFRR
jgi:hypothetical protein